MVTRRQLRKLQEQLQPDNKHTEFNVYFEQDDGSVSENPDGTGQFWTAEEWQQKINSDDDQVINISVEPDDFESEGKNE